MKIKNEPHHLIDNIENGQLGSDFNEDEKKELLVAYEESFDNNSLLSQQQVKQQHEKWLKS